MLFRLIYFKVLTYRFDVVLNMLAKLLAYYVFSYELNYEFEPDNMPNALLVDRTPSPLGSSVKPPTTVYLSDVVIWCVFTSVLN